MKEIGASFTRVTECTVNPKHVLPESGKIQPLTPWELTSISTDYVKFGLIFPRPAETPINTTIHHLKDSLSTTLTHFPSLTGRLVTKKGLNPPSLTISLDYINLRGAKFIHAVADHLTISYILSPNDDIPKVVDLFFPLKGALSYDGHTEAMVVIQVTELLDGMFLALCINHAIVDGISYWHFLNTWAEISRGNINCIPRPPITRTWFLDSQGDINLPFSNQDEFIKGHTPPLLREKMFHFSAKSISYLKARANMEASTDKISSFQALNAFVWRCMTRVRNLSEDQLTLCAFSINDRSRFSPPISDNCFGNYLQGVGRPATAGQILGNTIGSSALILHGVIASHTDEKIRTWVKGWEKNPIIYQLDQPIVLWMTVMANSPRFDVYGNDFGWGKPLGVRSEPRQKFDGLIYAYQGREEDGSVDLEINLFPESMTALLLDDEFMEAVS